MSIHTKNKTSGAGKNAYMTYNDTYEIRRRTQEVFIPPQIDADTSYVPNQEANEAKGPTQKRIARRRARRSRKKLIRQRRQRRRQRRLLALITVLLVFLFWLFLWLAPVPFGTVIVDGNDKMSFDDVYKASGIKNNLINVVQLSPDTMASELKKDLRVADADITREFPATIHIRMKERQVVAVVTTMYGFAYIDQTGTVIQNGSQIKGVSVPLITGKRVDTLLLGDTIHDQAILSSLEYLQDLSPDIRKTVTEINVGNPNEVVAYTSDSVPIHLGSVNEPGTRATLTEELLNEVKSKRLMVQYIDTDPQSPLVKSN